MISKKHITNPLQYRAVLVLPCSWIADWVRLWLEPFFVFNWYISPWLTIHCLQDPAPTTTFWPNLRLKRGDQIVAESILLCANKSLVCWSATCLWSGLYHTRKLLQLAGDWGMWAVVKDTCKALGAAVKSLRREVQGKAKKREGKEKIRARSQFLISASLMSPMRIWSTECWGKKNRNRSEGKVTDKQRWQRGDN